MSDNPNSASLPPSQPLQKEQSETLEQIIQEKAPEVLKNIPGDKREILAQVRAEEFPRRKLHIVATGGYARLIAAQMSEITAVRPHLTLEGLRIIANLNS